MLKSLLRDRTLLILLFISILIRLFALNATWVERYYTYGFYPVISKFMRLIIGWIPFSMGDILYLGAFIFLVAKAWKLIHLLATRKVKEFLSWILFRKYLKLVLWIYIIFNLSWGLNYDRLGIADQLSLDVQSYTNEELKEVTLLLKDQLNASAIQVDSIKREELNERKTLFREAVKCFQKVKTEFGFLQYSPVSIKPSLLSAAGHFFGFSGYLNPFTGEAQLNTREPVFIKPFVLNHEIAHQVGYGKENEASFVSYLACKSSDNNDFRYSIYYELFFSALRECIRSMDSTVIKDLRKDLHPRVINDRLFEADFRKRQKNRMQPLVTDFYDKYLRLNNQPKGMATYNEVIAWLVGYYRKFGEV